MKRLLLSTALFALVSGCGDDSTDDSGDNTVVLGKRGSAGEMVSRQ
jgi:hypothetical protein